MSASESSSYESERQNLLSRLIDATKECQLRFGGKGELATENDSRVAVLCAAWENCLKHGLKPSNRALAALKQVSDFTGLSRLKAGIFSEISDIETEPVFWHVVRETLGKHEVERYMVLKHITNDTGRGRAWLRSCLNEKSLERQLNGLKSNTKLISQYYEEWALIRDQQRFLLLANMASGLAAVLFAITIDADEINKVSTSPSSSAGPSTSKPTHQRTGSAGSIINSSSFTKLLPNSLLSTFQRPGDTRPVIGGSEAIAIPGMKNQNKGKKAAKIVSFDDDNDDDSRTSDTERSDFDTVVSASVPVTHTRQKETVSTTGLARNDSRVSILSSNSVYSYDEDAAPPMLTPLAPSGSPIPIDDDVRSMDSDIPSISCSWNEDSATALSLAAKTRSDSFFTRTQGDGSSLPEEKPHTAESMSTGELKQAIVTMMMKKDEIEEHNKLMRSMLTQEEEYTKGLKEELSQLTQTYEDRVARDQARIQSVTKDNELLKHQLKKYITAVQSLRRDGPNAENLGIHLDEPSPTITPSKLEDTVAREASEYKQKLIEVAEMHGELMEFNEHLQRQLLQKENVMKQLSSELVELRGPLPTDVNVVLQDSYGVQQNRDWKPLVNIWIPAAFMKGSNNNTHHVFQVFLRIKDDEWNVYRRYSELHSFYLSVKKKYPLVATFEFPPKKSMGNKTASFVDERRKRLQQFLRKAVQHIVASNTELESELTRARLSNIFPLLGEDKPVESKKKKKSGGRQPASPNNMSPGQHYTGL